MTDPLTLTLIGVGIAASALVLLTASTIVACLITIGIVFGGVAIHKNRINSQFVKENYLIINNWVVKKEEANPYKVFKPYLYNKEIKHDNIIVGNWRKKNPVKSFMGIIDKNLKEAIKKEDYMCLITQAHKGIIPPYSNAGYFKFKNWEKVSETLVRMVNRNKDYLKPKYEMQNRITGEKKGFFHECQAFDVYRSFDHGNGNVSWGKYRTMVLRSERSYMLLAFTDKYHPYFVN